MFPEVQVVDGSVEGRPISMDLPIEFLDARMLFELRDGGIRMDLHEDGTASGVVSGGLIVDDVVETILSVGVAPELKDLADTVMRFSADLAPDESGACTLLSVVLEFEARPVFVYEDLLADE
jgi:hypothetical protein